MARLRLLPAVMQGLVGWWGGVRAAGAFDPGAMVVPICRVPSGGLAHSPPSCPECREWRLI
jgi:hypothetical protein